MKPHLIYSTLAALLIYFLPCGPGYASEHKTAALNQKMSEITSLQQSLSNKISQVLQKRVQLEQKMAELEEEIIQEQKRRQIESFFKASRHPRIEFNLKLIQLLSGYIAGLTERIGYFKNGYQTLDFFRQQILDDLLMIQTLNDMEIDNLTDQINSVLDEFIPELGKPIFNINEILAKDPEKIWHEIIQPRTVKG